ncbi:S1C family serine protease [Nocardioides zeicaulis]|uniref:Trypsin-like peptidase domain-containing protein n=1 Tax=Nocardioides zeicaulis TaxID=1776857 RepID=A0ABV6DYI9_9ACTN
MTDEHTPDEQHPDEHPDEPTQPLAGWRAGEPPRDASPSSDTPSAASEASDSPAEPADPEQARSVQPEGRPYGAPVPDARAADHEDAHGAEDDRAAREEVRDDGRDQVHESAPETLPIGPPPPYAGPGPVPGPSGFGPGPYPGPGFGQPGQPGPYGQHVSRPPVRRLPLWVWPSVAALALVVGLLGGLAGGAIQDQLASPPGTVDNGLQGVRTRAAAPLDADNGSVPAVAQALLPSTVQIVAEYDGQAGGATGSGFVLDREGHVVTNNHVVASAASDDGPIVVIDSDGRRHDATIVGRSSVYDLAVLDVDGADALEPAALGASQALHVGDPVVAFGAPLGLSQTVTSGIVSALDRPVTTSGESDDDSSYINAVQTDAAINPGNSGGPLVNLAGEVVGVNSAIATTGGASTEAGNIGVGFAIPIEQVRTTVDQILRTGRAEYPVIGAQVQTGGQPDAGGATITEVMPDTPADRAGLQKDDVIVAVDDQPVNDGIALIVAIRTHLPGETVEMSVLRGGDQQVVEVELDGKVG